MECGETPRMQASDLELKIAQATPAVLDKKIGIFLAIFDLEVDVFL